MTPMINDIVRAAERREAIWDGNRLGFPTARSLLKAIAPSKTFFVEGAADSWDFLKQQHDGYLQSEDYLFCPAPTTWLEFANEDWLEGNRVAYLLSELPCGSISALVVLQKGGRRGELCVAERVTIRSAAPPMTATSNRFAFVSEVGAVEVDVHEISLKLGLSLVNLPIGIRSEIVEPNKARAQRARALGGGNAGTSYSKICLDYNVFRSVSRGKQNSGQKKRYHFCRAYLRTRRSGRQEHVRAHWRGDDALGRVEARYIVGRQASSATHPAGGPH